MNKIKLKHEKVEDVQREPVHREKKSQPRTEFRKLLVLKTVG